MFGALVNNIPTDGSIDWAMVGFDYEKEYYFLQYCLAFNIAILKIEESIFPDNSVIYTLTRATI
jgi:hypothetical protein